MSSAATAPLPERPTGMEPSLLIAGVSALLKAIDTWVSYRDSKRAAEAFQKEKNKPESPIEIREQGAILAEIVPKDILDKMIDRATQCWTKYGNVLDGDYLPDEIDEATTSVKACICRELRRIRSLGQPLPEGKLTEWWNLYCAQSDT